MGFIENPAGRRDMGVTAWPESIESVVARLVRSARLSLQKLSSIRSGFLKNVHSTWYTATCATALLRSMGRKNAGRASRLQSTGPCDTSNRQRRPCRPVALENQTFQYS
ncbi:unnamed protein product [Scytosiphon promiscuus]